MGTCLHFGLDGFANGIFECSNKRSLWSRHRSTDGRRAEFDGYPSTDAMRCDATRYDAIDRSMILAMLVRSNDDHLATQSIDWSSMSDDGQFIDWFARAREHGCVRLDAAKEQDRATRPHGGRHQEHCGVHKDFRMQEDTYPRSCFGRGQGPKAPQRGL